MLFHSVLSEDFDDPFNSSRQSVYLSPGIVESKGRSRSRRNIKPPHHGLSAMMAGAHGDAFLIEYRANVMRVNVVDHERQHAQFLPRGADDAHTFDSRQALSSIAQQLVL